MLIYIIIKHFIKSLIFLIENNILKVSFNKIIFLQLEIWLKKQIPFQTLCYIIVNKKLAIFLATIGDLIIN